MTHIRAFKKYYIATISSIEGSNTFILNHKQRGRLRRAITIKYGKRVRYRIRKNNMISRK